MRLLTYFGLNNHYQQVIFGACLMYDETANSFQWLFETFLKCMAHKYPQLIFTDQDVAMKKALSLSMPQPFHKLRLWHIRQNVMKHLGHLFKYGSSFARDLNAFIYSKDEEEFLLYWKEMLNMYELQDNSWLKGIFELKEKWAMTYGREYLSVGKESTQLSESFNARLKDYLKSDLDLV
ncbi:hypothetical protein LIER_33096 [Lithospermum erythrorhizon]|uniref:Protein FAR1-RELATED SEQUENCE n=1 Tax=Lithospermum erythrorhizon TaxID=34254 RepID=A0AAV3RVS9_LITER